MAWFPDSNWLRALDVKGSTAAAVGVACVAIFMLSELNWFYLGALPGWIRAVFAAVGVLAFSLFGGNLTQWLIDEYKEERRRRLKEREQKREEQEQERLRMKYREHVLGYLGTLGEAEREILSYLVQKNQQSFRCEMGGSRIATLEQKGLVEKASGVYNMMDWPYIVPNFVWSELQKRREEFNTADLGGSAPWRGEW